MEAYTDFASVYDTFMDETPYEEWAEFIHQLIKEYGISLPGASVQSSSSDNAPSTTVSVLAASEMAEVGSGCGSVTGSVADSVVC